MINISIVLFHNQIEEIKNLLKDLTNSSRVKINKIFLIDNSFHDNLSKLKFIDKKIEYIYTNKNMGYGRANNIAINKSIEANIKYHLVINPDIRIEGHVLYELFTYMENNSNVGLVMPDIKYPDGDRQHLCKLLPTPLSLFSRRFLPHTISEKFNKKYNLLEIDYTKQMNVPLLSGCFMFMRVSVLKDVGYFDSRFFMYLEDFDLIRRIHKKYKTIFYPAVHVTHVHAKESYKSKKLLINHILSAVKYFNKYGWVFDNHRRKINKEFLKTYHTK